MPKNIELTPMEYLTLAYGNIVFVVSAISKKLGREKVEEALTSVIIEENLKRGKRMAKVMGNNSLNDLLEHERQELFLPQELRESHLMEWEIVEQTDDKIEIKITRCLFAEAFKELGDTELGYIISCEQDFHFAKGFNPKIKLTRTKTLMEGHDYCDHCWKLMKEDEG